MARTRRQPVSVARIMRCGWISMVLFSLAAFSVYAQERAAELAETRFSRPTVIKLSGDINWNNATYFQNRVARAKQRGADLLIIEIDSYGGLVNESLRIADILKEIDWAYTVAYIPEKAISGAALLSLGCDEIILGAGAVYGDVGAIEFDPQLFAFRYVPEKAQSLLVQQARVLAESKNRPPEIAEAMIDKQMLLFQRQGEGPAAFQLVRLEEGQAPRAAAEAAGLDLDQWELVEESGADRFLTVNGRRAVELGIGAVNVESREQLLEHLAADPADIVTYRYNTRDSVVYFLNHPAVTILLIIIGIIALYVELSAPGIGAGGLIALLCAALFFWSRYMGGTTGALEIILFLAGITFLLMELFVIPGWGISGFLGLALILTSAVLAGLDFVVPETPHQWNVLITHILLIICSSVVGLIGVVLAARKLGSIPLINKIILAPRESQPAMGDTAGMAGPPGKSDKRAGPVHPLVSIGDWGVAESVLRPAGRVRFGSTSVDVVTDGSYVAAGQQVKVVELTGNRIVVVPVEEEATV